MSVPARTSTASHASYSSTSALVGMVLARCNTEIARERSRVRRDRTRSKRLETHRAEAARTLGTLASSDQGALEAVCDRYARIYLELDADADLSG